MALHHNPRIVTSGLVFHVDAADRNSYPGTGNTWYDLTGNGSHLTITGFTAPPVWEPTENGRFAFDGITSRGYMTGTGTSALQSMSDFTIIVWARHNSTAAQNRYYVLDTRKNSSTGAGLGFDRNSTTTFDPFHFAQVGGYDEFAENAYEFNSDTTYQLGVARIGSDIKTIENDSQTLSTPSTIAGGTLTTSTINNSGLVVGTFESAGGTTPEYFWDGYIYAIMIYNRALTTSEVTQNYQALNTRFGL